MNTIMPKCKVLFLSNINGNFQKVCELYNKITSKSGEFNLIILIGNVFNVDENFSLLNSLSDLNTDILIFDSSSVNAVLKAKINFTPFEYSNNIIILGRSGVYTHNKTNLTFCYLSGVENSFYLNKSKQYYTGDSFTYHDFNLVMSEMNKINHRVDFVLLSVIPQILFQEIQSDFSSPYHNEDININKSSLASDKISYCCNLLLKKISPRYIFISCEDFYYERKPYINNSRFLSRFIHLGYFQSKVNQKEKYIYALNTKAIHSLNDTEINQLDDMTTTRYTLSPFGDNVPDTIEQIVSFRSKYNGQNIKVYKDELFLCNLDRFITYEELNDFLSQFGKVLKLRMIYDVKKKFSGNAYVTFNDLRVHSTLIEKNNYYTLRGRKVGIRERIEKILSPEDVGKSCWFCFCNPGIEKDLILKEFKNFYLAYPKGPIDKMHFLLLPKKHIQCYAEIDSSLKGEYKGILASITNFIEMSEMSYFIYEKNLPYNNIAARHMVVNIVGVDRGIMVNYSEQGSDFFEEKKIKYEISYDDNKIDQIEKNQFYYYINGSTGVKIGKKEKRLIYYIKVAKDTKDFTNYGRALICYLNESEDKLNWKNCQVDQKFYEQLKGKIKQYYLD